VAAACPSSPSRMAFKSHPPFEHWIPGQIDRAHAALTQEGFHLEPTHYRSRSQRTQTLSPGPFAPEGAGVIGGRVHGWETFYFVCRLLRRLDEFLDAAGIGLAVAMAGEGSLPPVLSTRMSAQNRPVSMRTLATFDRWMLISFTVNQDRLRRTDSRVRDFDDGREQVVALGPTAGMEGFGSSECILRGGGPRPGG